MIRFSVSPTREGAVLACRELLLAIGGELAGPGDGTEADLRPIGESAFLLRHGGASDHAWREGHFRPTLEDGRAAFAKHAPKRGAVALVWRGQVVDYAAGEGVPVRLELARAEVELLLELARAAVPTAALRELVDSLEGALVSRGDR